MKEYKDLPVLAEELKPDFLYYYKKNRKKLEKMDLEVHQIHDEVSSRIDCLTCSNCCRTLGPAIYDKDIERMAKALRMKSSEVISTYLKIDEDDDYVFQSMPCPFLMADNSCSIYANRPKACREYPHTDRKKFAQIYQLTITNASTCPIAYEVLKKLLDK